MLDVRRIFRGRRAELDRFDGGYRLVAGEHVLGLLDDLVGRHALALLQAFDAGCDVLCPVSFGLAEFARVQHLHFRDLGERFGDVEVGTLQHLGQFLLVAVDGVIAHREFAILALCLQIGAGLGETQRSGIVILRHLLRGELQIGARQQTRCLLADVSIRGLVGVLAQAVEGLGSIRDVAGLGLPFKGLFEPINARQTRLFFLFLLESVGCFLQGAALIGEARRVGCVAFGIGDQVSAFRQAFL